MPKLDGTGPQGEGPQTGRAIGKCKNNDKNLIVKLGKGLGLMKNDGCGKGLGKRLKYNYSKNQASKKKYNNL